MVKTQKFYANLSTFSDFKELCNMGNYAPLPDDWLIVLTDIEGSTKAINAGKYRAVNAVGVASIIAVINAVKPISIPFIFGGDGATLCVPSSQREVVKAAILGAKRLALEQFDLSLRVGMIPVKDVRRDGYEVLVGKHQVSDAYVQAVFRGGGAGYAEKLLKMVENDHYRFELEDAADGEAADFSGFECRWQDVPSRHGEDLSLIVTTQEAHAADANTIYNEILDRIDAIYGGASSYAPLHPDALQLNTEQEKLAGEVAIRNSLSSRIARFFYQLRLSLVIWATLFVTSYQIGTYKQDWDAYRKDVVANSDYRKFDDTLRMVISGTPRQSRQLISYLQKLYQAGKIFYGTHSADATLITCMVFDYESNHFHFIDGSNGGYALAAAGMKKQMRK